jgi:hypothetical protein
MKTGKPLKIGIGFARLTNDRLCTACVPLAVDRQSRKHRTALAAVFTPAQEAGKRVESVAVGCEHACVHALPAMEACDGGLPRHVCVDRRECSLTASLIRL